MSRSFQAHRVLAALAALALAATLAACAPEPETGGAEAHGKNPIEEGEASYPTPPEEAFAKSTVLPEGFPADAFTIPEGAVIDDAGVSDTGRWFVVFRSADAQAADALWGSVIDNSGFTAGETQETTEGGVHATLTNQQLAVQVATIPQPDGSVLLSYDIESLAL